MPLKFCPSCGDRIQTAANNTDVIHQCNTGDATLDEEDVLRIGAYEDYSGSGASIPMPGLLGAGNDLQATDAGLRGARFDGVTDRGKNKKLYRQRPKQAFIEFK